MKTEDILKKYWGFDSFRPNQVEIVKSVVNGHDTFALLPTGGGKSICFQVPGIARKGLCLVISPLIALMQDQVKNLKDRGLKAAAITSGMTRREIDIILDNAKFGALDFLYVSPERLKTELFIARFKQMNLSLIAIDEAHCISEWGHDFRPPYLDIHELRLIHPEVPMIALTATATKRVQEDIIHQLKLKEPNCFEGDFQRENLSYEIYKVVNKHQALLRACERFQGMTGIVYCQTRKSTKDIARLLLAHNYSVGIYNGGMDNEARKKQLESWMIGKTKIIVATNAFGMGIDKPDVRFVLHYELPNNLEAYFQEAGRSGRDGKAARNLGFYEENDLIEMKKKLVDQFPDPEFVKTVYRALCNHLSIAIGSGASETYNLDLKSFLKKYGLDTIPAYNALKILELNKTITLNEAVFHPTRLKFAVNNKTLYDFQLRYEKHEAITVLLSRTYPGIFSNFFEIQESKLGARLKLSTREVKGHLSFLEKQGIIDIVWQSENPQITFLHERLPDNYLQLNQEIYNKRKKVAQDKLDGMLKFLTTPQCRSQLLISYFGQQSEACGKCDVCLAEQKNNYTTKELQLSIETILTTKPTDFESIVEELSLKDTNQLKQVLHWMLDEGIITFKEMKYAKN